MTVMATPDLLSSPLIELRKGENGKSRGLSIEKKIELLESLTGKVKLIFTTCEWLSFHLFVIFPEMLGYLRQVTNRRSRRWLNDRLLNAEEIRGLFAPPPWGNDTFCWISLISLCNCNCNCIHE
ncbi:hypothetical protein HRI_003781800 [Hibiscus trionum]|uniref:R3H-associated N-terminal domain-containing protein n=1 Tax=Hibiscus trionum TaxID=183268 RepID=A0A9W7IT74_HIBTR|nr:hypothetical protein HRI_003781800 [Hibiscus trionum]